MTIRAPHVIIPALAIALGGVADKVGNGKLDVFGLLDSNPAISAPVQNVSASVAQEIASETYGGQINMHWDQNIGKWCIDHVEIEGQEIDFDKSNGDFLQPTPLISDNYFHVAVTYNGKRLYAKGNYPKTANPYGQHLTFFDREEDRVVQNVGTQRFSSPNYTGQLP